MPTKVTPKDFFLWLGAVVSIYGSIFAFIALLFEYIDYAFPDSLSGYIDPYSSSIRFEMASLIVLVPVALVLMRFIRKDIERVAEKSELWVRRWALVLTVFLAGGGVVGDLIALINSFLGGDLTTRFVLKVLVVLLVAGAVFMHFLADLRGFWIMYPSRARTVGVAAGVAVLFSIVAGFFIMGSPNQVRLLRFDNQKVNDLQTIQWQIVNYWQQKQKLPATLADLQDPIEGFMAPKDPQSGKQYEYRSTAAISFELCANFNLNSTNSGAQSVARPVAYPNGAENDNWSHGEGRHCFTRTIDPERYPPFPKGNKALE